MERATTAAPAHKIDIGVRYFAGARAAAGTASETVPVPAGCTVAELAALLGERHGAALGRVLAAATFLVDEVSSGRDQRLTAPVTVDVLPPFAGG